MAGVAIALALPQTRANPAPLEASAVNRRSTRPTGFTLIELLLIFVIVGLVTAMGLPALQQMIHRSKLEGFVRNTGVTLQAARFEAIKRGDPTVVEFHTDIGDVVTFVDTNSDGIQDETDFELNRHRMPAGVMLLAPESESIFEGFDTTGTSGLVVFNSDGSVERQGAVRFADMRSNYLEARVEPRGTARIEIRKWNGEKWLATGHDGNGWEWH